MTTHKRPKKIFPIIVAVLITGLFGGTLWFLYAKSRPTPIGLETEKPSMAEIIKKAVAAGAIQPRKEIEIKPRVAGILKTLHVEAGDTVKKGDLIAEIQIIPDVMNLNEAELRLKASNLAAEKVKRELDRSEALGAKGAATLTDLDRLRSDHALATEELRAAHSRVQLVREGAIGRSKGALTRVESTVDGMILAILIREGNSVINANSFNPGSTIAVVADMTDMIFKGRVDESDVGKLREGMPVEIIIGALEDRRFPGKLEHIAPKNMATSATTEFEIEAAFRPPEGVLVRAGYSANANIVLDRREKVLAINESLLVFDKDKRYIEVEVAPDRFERREVKLGLSDGIKVEVLSGVKLDDVLKKPTRPTSTAPATRS
jgi:HlyD family secretion protein